MVQNPHNKNMIESKFSFLKSSSCCCLIVIEPLVTRGLEIMEEPELVEFQESQTHWSYALIIFPTSLASQGSQ
jgi:hypothetical protein